MIVRNETWDGHTGQSIFAEVIDLEAGTVTGYEHGVLIWTRDLTAAERAAQLPKGLDPLGALATLLAVREVVPVEEAAAAIGLPAQALVDEALAWGVASAIAG